MHAQASATHYICVRPWPMSADLWEAIAWPSSSSSSSASRRRRSKKSRSSAGKSGSRSRRRSRGRSRSRSRRRCGNRSRSRRSSGRRWGQNIPDGEDDSDDELLNLVQEDDFDSQATWIEDFREKHALTQEDLEDLVLQQGWGFNLT